MLIPVLQAEEIGDAKILLEEYVHSMETKLCGPLRAFMHDKDRISFCAQLTVAMDLLYEGEDQLKQVYVDTLADLKVCMREYVIP